VPPGPSNSAEAALKQNEQLWSSQKIANYYYRLQVICFCPPDITRPAIVSVNNGVPVSMVDAATGETRSEQSIGRYTTVEGLFAIIRDAIQRKAEELTVEYDPKLGYPRSVRIDYLRTAADEEISFSVAVLETIGPGVSIQPAVVEEVRTSLLKSNPPQVSVYVKGGLRDGCTTLHAISWERTGNTVTMYVTSQRPLEAQCPAVYTYFERDINLGVDFAAGVTYTLNVNDKTLTFGV